MKVFEVLIVGSGPAAAMAAQTAVEAGKDVTVIDTGIFNRNYFNEVPNKNFIDLRTTDKNQRDYMLGKDFEGISWGKIKTGSQLTPPRKFVLDRVNEFLPKLSESFFPMESLAYGGLGSAWGLGCYSFSENELHEAGLSTEIRNTYQLIANRIGIAGEKDDANDYALGPIQHHQPAQPLDNNQSLIYEKYIKNKKLLNEKGFFLGRTPLALLSKDLESRKKDELFDMDFYHDNQLSGYRPWITIENLKAKSNFNYLPGYLVTSFKEVNELTEITALNIETSLYEKFITRKLILCAGALGTARIVLRSLAKPETRIPVLCNPYCYMPCLNLGLLGKALNKDRTGLSQLVMFYDQSGKNKDAGMCSLFTYRSLLLHKLIKEAPLNYRDGRIIMNYLQSAFVIAGIHHPERSGPEKYLQLQQDNDSPTGDKLFSNYRLSDSEIHDIAIRERAWKKAMRKLNCFPIKQIYPGHGSSIHYAGTLPFSNESQELHLSPEGKLHSTKNVYVADSSGFKYLPAKGLTLTIMANAHLTMKNAIKE